MSVELKKTEESMTRCNYVRHGESNQTAEQTEENSDVGPNVKGNSVFGGDESSFVTFSHAAV